MMESDPTKTWDSFINGLPDFLTIEGEAVECDHCKRGCQHIHSNYDKREENDIKIKNFYCSGHGYQKPIPTCPLCRPSKPKIEDEILNIINRGLKVDGKTCKAKDAIGSAPQDTVRSTLAYLIGFLDRENDRV